MPPGGWRHSGEWCRMGCDGLKERECAWGEKREEKNFGCEKGGSILYSPLGNCKYFSFYGVP